MVDKLVEIGILFDFYGKLLSNRQYTAIELYYIHDLSLAEIGEELGISRQSVYDTLKRAEQKLYEYEDILGLVDKFETNKNQIIKIANLVAEIEKESEGIKEQKTVKKLLEIKGLVGKIIESS